MPALEQDQGLLASRNILEPFQTGRLKVHPPPQVVEARVVAEGIVPLLRFGGSHHFIKNPQQVFAHDLGHILTTVPSS